MFAHLSYRSPLLLPAIRPLMYNPKKIVSSVKISNLTGVGHNAKMKCLSSVNAIKKSASKFEAEGSPSNNIQTVDTDSLIDACQPEIVEPIEPVKPIVEQEEPATGNLGQEEEAYINQKGRMIDDLWIPYNVDVEEALQQLKLQGLESGPHREKNELLVGPHQMQPMQPMPPIYSNDYFNNIYWINNNVDAVGRHVPNVVPSAQLRMDFTVFQPQSNRLDATAPVEFGNGYTQMPANFYVQKGARKPQQAPIKKPTSNKAKSVPHPRYNKRIQGIADKHLQQEAPIRGKARGAPFNQPNGYGTGYNGNGVRFPAQFFKHGNQCQNGFQNNVGVGSILDSPFITARQRIVFDIYQCIFYILAMEKRPISYAKLVKSIMAMLKFTKYKVECYAPYALFHAVRYSYIRRINYRGKIHTRHSHQAQI